MKILDVLAAIVAAYAAGGCYSAGMYWWAASWACWSIINLIDYAKRP